MCGVLQQFIFYQRQGDWQGHLSETAKMLLYLTAASHYKYGQQSLPLYLQDMKLLPDNAPKIHDFLQKAGFFGGRSYWSHNAVSPDMLLEQAFDADTKEEGGLCSIYTNAAARTKWVYTKFVTAATGSILKTMLHLHQENSAVQS